MSNPNLCKKCSGTEEEHNRFGGKITTKSDTNGSTIRFCETFEPSTTTQPINPREASISEVELFIAHCRAFIFNFESRGEKLTMESAKTELDMLSNSVASRKIYNE